MLLTTGGGLGDAAISYAKIVSSHSPFYPVDIDSVKVMHTTNKRGKGRFGESIKRFYEYQGLDCEVVFLNRGETDSWRNKNKFDYCLGTSWKKENDDCMSWEIDPFPPIYYEPIEKIDVVITPMTQWDMGRYISLSDLKLVVNRIPEKYNIVYIGWAEESYTQEIDKLRGTSYLNTGDVSSLVDMVCSSSIVIGCIGFVVQLAGLADKKVIWTGSVKPPEIFHPDQDSMYISNLTDYNWEAL